MGNETLISAARAAGFAMAASEDLLTPAARRTGEASSPRSPDAPATEAPKAAPAPEKLQFPALFPLNWSFWKTA